MGGCTNCGEKAGCDHRKNEMLSEVEVLMTTLYPTRRWGEIDYARAWNAGVGSEDGQALAEELASELDAATVFREGSEDQLCDFIYVLCVGREPCAIQIRDGDVPLPAELAPGTIVQEQYLRMCLSSLAPVAAVQQVSVDMTWEEDGWTIREAPRAGVYDAPLLRRFQRLVALLPAYGILHVDFGEISAPPEGFDAGSYRELYGGEPDRVSYLFYPEPSTLIVTSTLPATSASGPLRS